MKNIILIFLCVILLFSSNSIAKDFTDVSSEHWAYDYIDLLSNSGVIDGFDDGTFNPNSTITMAQYIKLLVCTVATEEEQVDLKNEMKNYSKWYEPYIKYVTENDITDKKFNEKSLNSFVSREMMANLLVDFLDFVEYDASELVGFEDGDYDMLFDESYEKDFEETSNEFEEEVDFTDIDKLDDISQNNIYYLRDLELINGYEDGTFKPQNNMTRAEVSTIIYRFAKLINTLDYQYYYEDEEEIFDDIEDSDDVDYEDLDDLEVEFDVEFDDFDIEFDDFEVDLDEVE